MLEVRKYTKPELTEMLGTKGVQGLKRKLDGYGVEFIHNGWGENSTFDIVGIQDPFKVYCITELGYSANTDFDKLAYFLYYYFNDEEFMTMPDEVKERRMAANGNPLTRQTIANYTNKLTKLGMINKFTTNYIYYFAYKGEQIITTAQEYKRAWRGYWLDIDDGMHSWDAIWNMRITYGGVARKQPIPDVNVFYDGQIEEIVDLAVNHIWKEVEQKI